MNAPDRLRDEHRDVTRRYFLQLGTAGVAGLGLAPLWARGAESDAMLAEAVAKLEYLTPESRFAGGGRGKPPPNEMTVDQRRAVGLEQETWQLEVVADPKSDVQIERPLSKELGTALGLDRADGPGRKTCRALLESGDLFERRKHQRHGAVGGRAAA